MFVLNRSPLRRSPLDAADRRTFDVAACAQVMRLLGLCPRHSPTPLVRLPNLAKQLGLACLAVKDEGGRLGLKSFKALGGTYAVILFVLAESANRLGTPVDPRALLDSCVRSIASGLTVACATDGNHGRAVAAGASLTGCKAVVFVPEGVTGNRIRAIETLGARVERITGSYDDAVEAASLTSLQQGWHLVADTARESSEAVPRTVMQGYTVALAEALGELEQTPTHIFVQAGVGSFAGAVGAYLASACSGDRPRLVVVEPQRAACIHSSYLAGRPVRIADKGTTVMSMLDCKEPSAIAWEILIRTAEAFMTVDEPDAINAMARFGRPESGDPPIVSGESGAVGLAGLLAALRAPEQRLALGLGPAARVLLFNTEGATDPELYARLMGTDCTRSD